MDTFQFFWSNSLHPESEMILSRQQCSEEEIFDIPRFTNRHYKPLDGLLREVKLHELVEDDENDGGHHDQPHHQPRHDDPSGVATGVACTQVLNSTCSIEANDI